MSSYCIQIRLYLLSKKNGNYNYVHFYSHKQVFILRNLCVSEVQIFLETNSIFWTLIERTKRKNVYRKPSNTNLQNVQR